MPKKFYVEQKAYSEQKISEYKKKLRLLNWIRGLAFICVIAFSYIAFSVSSRTVGFVVLIISLLGFIFLIQVYLRQKEKKDYFVRLLEINENELKALDYDFSVFESGEEYADSKHNFSSDLDLFGQNSVYQMINRANTRRGKDKTAKYFNSLLKDVSQIEAIQKSVSELTKYGKWMQKFLALSKHITQESKKANYSLFSVKTKQKSEISGINNLSKNLEKNSGFKGLFWKIACIILPIIAISMLIFSILGFFTILYVFTFSIFMLTVSGIKIKYTNSVHADISKQAKIFNRYAKLFAHIEQQEFQSKQLIELQKKLTVDGKKVSVIIHNFAQLLNAFDNRLNIFFILLANSFLLWDVQIVRRVEIWTKKYSDYIATWFDTVAEFEYLISLSTFSFNNPEFIFPELSTDFSFSSTNLGHPSIINSQRVVNNFSISEKTKTFIVTGANMAGKSTFLRTIGVNFVLAQIGSVVCATQMKIKPMQLLTSIKITDSLSSNESYFYAELKRLQYIVELVENGTEALIIIDEMLRGTNSTDKHKGSEGLLRKLTKLNVITFLATHDVDLGKLINEFPDLLKNKCFEAEIINNELSFDYKLRDGVSKNLNASFLMKKMKIIDKE